MSLFGEKLSPKLLSQVKRTFAVTCTIFGLSVAGFAISTFMKAGHVSSMKQEIESKVKQIAQAEKNKEEQKALPVNDVPKGLGAIGAFQTRITQLARTKSCAIAQFQASDQSTPYISTFASGAQVNGSWMQVEVKMNLQGSTQAVIGTLKDMSTLNIPFEFTSVEMSRTQVTPTGDATITANVSIRVLITAGGA